MTHDPDGDKESVAARRYGGTDQRQRIHTQPASATGEDWVAHFKELLVKPHTFSPMVRMDTGEPVTDRQWREWRNL